MAVQTDDEPKDTRRLAFVLIVIGLYIGVIVFTGAYLFTYEGLGPGPDDTQGREAVTISIVFGIMIVIALLFAGVSAYWLGGRDDS